MIPQLALASAALVLATAAPSQKPVDAASKAGKLATGAAAPALSVEKWVKGAPVKEFAKGQVYVVEFWATWCGPCIASMPHLSELQRRYKDKGVTIIGVTTEDPRNPLTAVEKMVTDKGAGMDYTVAWDKGRETADAFMKASQQRGIPCSFLVDKQGTLAYIGHPMYLDVPLEKVVAGTWDVEKGNAALGEARAKMGEIFEAVGKDPQDAVKKIAEFEKAYPDYAKLVASSKFEALLGAGEFDAAYAHGKKLVDEAIEHGDVSELNQIAWTIVDPAAARAKLDLPLAMRAAQKAVDLTKSNDASILDTLARVHFLQGDVAKAIELQTKAVSIASEGMKASLEKTLAEYQAKGQK